jgi:hypothetical protein
LREPVLSPAGPRPTPPVPFFPALPDDPNSDDLNLEDLNSENRDSEILVGSPLNARCHPWSRNPTG